MSVEGLECHTQSFAGEWIYPNGSVVSSSTLVVSLIFGEERPVQGLECHTQSRHGLAGRWTYPNGSVVVSSSGFAFGGGGEQIVLYLWFDDRLEPGMYRCETTEPNITRESVYVGLFDENQGTVTR